jgi:hypothetical protein
MVSLRVFVGLRVFATGYSAAQRPGKMPQVWTTILIEIPRKTLTPLQGAGGFACKQ